MISLDVGDSDASKNVGREFKPLGYMGAGWNVQLRKAR